MAGKTDVELKGGMYTFMSLKLKTVDLAQIDECIADKVQQAPGFFKDSPVVVDLTVIEDQLSGDDAPSTAVLFEHIRKHKLLPIVATVNDKSSPIASTIELPLLESGIKRQDDNSDDKASDKEDATNSNASDANGGQSLNNAESNAENNNKSAADLDTASSDDAAAGDAAKKDASDSSGKKDKASDDVELMPAKQIEVIVKSPMLVRRPVRSGQQVYARDTDLIIMGQVGAGAEVIADQNIHVYGPLRGRALCGVSGNTNTRIFCQSLEAELVSVAGNYRVLEEIPPDLRGKPAQIWLDKDRLNIEPLVDTNLSGVIA